MTNRKHQYQYQTIIYIGMISLSSMILTLPKSLSFKLYPLRSNRGRIKYQYNNEASYHMRKAHHSMNTSSSSLQSSLRLASTSNIDNKELILQQRTDILRTNSKLSLAPMMEYTDRHFRHLVRLLSPKTLLYTEMVAANAIAHERDNALTFSNSKSLVDANFVVDPSYILRFLGQGHNPEGASVLQLGGSDPDQLYLAAQTVYEFNQMQQKQMQQNNNEQVPIYCDYSAINLNCGCPSPKVAGKGCFGASLMQEPDLVRQLTTSMSDGAEGTMPITVKCRIGTDEGYTFNQKEYLSRSEEAEYQNLKRFVEIVASDGIVTDFQIHARIAVLGKNYSPADNRKVPPLRYNQVRRLADEYPELNISLNGGVDTLTAVKRELDECNSLEGVMVGRGYVANPWSFAMADEILYGSSTASTSRPKNRLEVLEAYGKHADYEEETYDPTRIRRFMTKAISHLFAGEPNAKRYRILLDEYAGIPKKLERERKQNPDAVQTGQPPISELIMNAATTHLSEEVLYRSPEESYEKMLWEEEQAERKKNVVGTVIINGGAQDGSNSTKSLVQEWQSTRREDERKEREETRLDISAG